MSMFTQDRRSGIVDWAGEFGAAVTAALARWRDKRRSVVRLSDLDDHLLADIGLRRDQIDEVAQAGKLEGWGA